MRKFIFINVMLVICACVLVSAGCKGKPPSSPAPAPTTGWTAVGGGEVAAGDAISGQLFSSGGTPYAVYVDINNGNKLTVRKFNGTSWALVGAAGFTPGTVTDYIYALSVYNGTPYVAFQDNLNGGNLTVMKFDGANWVNVGTADFDTLYGSKISLDVTTGTPYVAFMDYNGGLNVMTLSGSTWVDVGGNTISDYAGNIAMAVFNGHPYVAFNDYYNSRLSLMEYTGSSWVEAANTSDMIMEDYGQTLVVSNGTLYLIYYSSNDGAVAMKLAGSTLQSIGTPGSISGTDSIEYITGAVYNGVPYVGFDDETKDSDPTPEAATVKYFNNSSWQLYAGYPDPCDIELTTLAADQSTGHLYFSYQDCTGYMTVKVH
jgi:hypothetical protein